ncbi:MAG: UDP-N-acetylmuramoyl-L-alanine--D-glutamate ligase [Deltaproteobacteria bacterium]|nr:UDP-N-acetylmuramoyl-L-alanine--D-glutamate ligase [Deltaproteobacteria bacterium]
MGELRHTKVLIAGFGASGRAAARYCARSGARVRVCDDAPTETFAEAVREFADWPVQYRFGATPVEWFTETDLVVASPGIPPAHTGLKAARDVGVPVISEMELALHEAPRPVIAVTGTNGKSTTTSLIGAICGAAGIPVAVGGNLGTPMCDLLTEAASARYWVIEVSSFQLEITPSIHPAIAVLLNVTPDHLDRYPNFQGYVEAKARLLAHLTPADALIWNAEDPVAACLASSCAAVPVPFWSTGTPKEICDREGYGACWNDGRVRAVIPSHMVHEWDWRRTALIGTHNRENMLAAGLAAAIAGAPATIIAGSAREFSGLPHRCRLVREWRGVRFFDDSKGTNVGAVVKSLQGFAEQVVLIAGGLDKGTGYSALLPVAREKVRCAVLLGQAREQMKAAMADVTETALAATMSEAVRMAAAHARPGDVVLLSPACASFDMYRNYAERGDDFIRCVMEL